MTRDGDSIANFAILRENGTNPGPEAKRGATTPPCGERAGGRTAPLEEEVLSLLRQQAEALTAELREMEPLLFAPSSPVRQIDLLLRDPAGEWLHPLMRMARSGGPREASSFALRESPRLTAFLARGEGGWLDPEPGRETGDRCGGRCFACPLLTDDGLWLGFVRLETVADGRLRAIPEENLRAIAAPVVSAVIGRYLRARRLVDAVWSLAAIAGLRDGENGQHQQRVAWMARLMAEGMADNHGLSADFINMVALGASIHDIGEMVIPDAVLHKQGALSARDHERLKEHVHHGLAILDAQFAAIGGAVREPVGILRNIIGYHHERLDGNGYPGGIAGYAIPLEARIVAVADVFDGLTRPYPHRTPWSFDQALAEVRHMAAGGMLDAECVDTLRGRERELRAGWTGGTRGPS